MKAKIVEPHGLDLHLFYTHFCFLTTNLHQNIT
nr:MAG TPA: hypothetical protein [Caudoviricetes sp.]